MEWLINNLGTCVQDGQLVYHHQKHRLLLMHSMMSFSIISDVFELTFLFIYLFQHMYHLPNLLHCLWSVHCFLPGLISRFYLWMNCSTSIFSLLSFFLSMEKWKSRIQRNSYDFYWLCKNTAGDHYHMYNPSTGYVTETRDITLLHFMHFGKP